MISFTEEHELNELLNVVHRAAVEDVLKLLPTFIMTMLQNGVKGIQEKDQFLKDNPDMVDQRELLAGVITQLEETHAGRPTLEILNEAARKVREMKHGDNKGIREKDQTPGGEGIQDSTGVTLPQVASGQVGGRRYNSNTGTAKETGSSPRAPRGFGND